MSKYEQLIEFIINDEHGKAKELFHQIVIAKSRDIYESLMDDESGKLIGGNSAEDLVDEISADEQGMHEEEEGDEEGAEEVGAEDGEELDGEEGGLDDLEGEEGEMGDEMGGEEGPIEDRVMDLEAALDELKAEFDSLMGAEEEEEHLNPGIHGDAELGGDEMGDMGDELGGDEFGGEELPGDEMGGDEELAPGEHVVGEVVARISEAKKKEEEKKAKADKEEKAKKDKADESRRPRSAAELMREYVDKVGEVYKGEMNPGEGKMVGKEQSSKPSMNTKSIVAGKNDMGGTTANIAKGGDEKNPDGKPVPKASNEYTKKQGELPGAGKFQNVPGSNAGKSSYKTKEAGHGAEKSGAGEGKLVGDDGSVSPNKKSTIGGKIR